MSQFEVDLSPQELVTTFKIKPRVSVLDLVSAGFVSSGNGNHLHFFANQDRPSLSAAEAEEDFYQRVLSSLREQRTKD